MSNVSTRLMADGKEVVIAVNGRFDFSVHKDFREAYCNAERFGVQYTLDLSRTEYLDSSALGMILLLREHAGGERANIVVRNANPEVEKILRIANFDKLIKIGRV